MIEQIDDKYTVKTFLELNDSEILAVNNIFFESSGKKQFPSKKEKEEFQYKYLDFYKVFYPHYFFVLCDEKPVGYTCGVPEILKAKKLFEITQHLHAFKEMYKELPGHLHINMAAESRGKGLGTVLINQFEKALIKDKIKGLHIITSPNARNCTFYLKNDFNIHKQNTYKDIEYKFMGKYLKFD